MWLPAQRVPVLESGYVLGPHCSNTCPISSSSDLTCRNHDLGCHENDL